jgi:hypothetical protein
MADPDYLRIITQKDPKVVIARFKARFIETLCKFWVPRTLIAMDEATNDADYLRLQ